MLLHGHLPSYPPAEALMPESEAETLTGWLAGTGFGAQFVERDLRDRHAERLDAASRDLELLAQRVKNALALWSVPEMAPESSDASLGVPGGAHPFRILSALLETGVRGELADPEAAGAWAVGFQGEMSRRWQRPVSAGDLAILDLMRFGFPVKSVSRSAEVTASSWGPDASMVLTHLQTTMTAACRLRAHGVEASSRAVAVGERYFVEEQAVVLDVVRRHLAGAPFPVPPLRQGDLVMLSTSMQDQGRALSVMLMPLLGPDPVTRARRPRR